MSLLYYVKITHYITFTSTCKRTIYVAKTAKSNSEEHVLEQKFCTTSLGTSRWKIAKREFKDTYIILFEFKNVLF